MKKSRAIECKEKRNYWEKMLSRWQASGLSQIEFCRRNGLNRHRFQYWKRRTGKNNQTVPIVELGGLSSVCTGYSPKNTGLGLIIDGRFRIEIPDGFNPATLEQLIDTLGRL